MAAETEARARIKSVIETEFAVEEVEVENDKIVRAAGRDGRRRVACSPDGSQEVPRNVNELTVDILLQWYEPFVAEPDETIVVDPAGIEDIAARLRTAFGASQGGVTSDMWFIRLRRIEFPDDPSGNKSRLEARFTAWADNAASVGG